MEQVPEVTSLGPSGCVLPLAHKTLAEGMIQIDEQASPMLL